MINQSYDGYNLLKDNPNDCSSFGYILIDEKTDRFAVHDEIDNENMGYNSESHLTVSFNLFFQIMSSGFSSDNVNSFPIDKDILEEATTKEIIFLNYIYSYFGFSTFSSIHKYLEKNKIEHSYTFI